MTRNKIFWAGLFASAVLQLVGVMAQQAQYITVATAVARKPGGAVRTMNATIQVILEAHTPPEISHGNHLSWEHGKTKVILQSTWAAGASEQPWRDSYLRVSTKACNDSGVAATSNAYGSTGRRLEWQLNIQGTNITTQNGLTTVTHDLSAQRIVMDRNSALCVVLANKQSQPQLRAAPMPVTPDFPSSFHTGIEATITEKGYTFHVYESYSAACNSVMFSFHNPGAGYMRILTDYKNSKMWHMHPPNATFPKGVCTSEPLDPNSSMVSFAGKRLTSAGRFLGFIADGGRPAEFQPPPGGFQDLVRGVPVDEWMYKEAGRDTDDAKNITGRYTVHLYFSSPEWHFGPSSGYRMIQRIALKGRHIVAGGEKPVTHSYDFMDFLPFIPPYITFEPCEMLPEGEGCDCIDLGCTSVSPEGVSFFMGPKDGAVGADNGNVAADTATADPAVAGAEPCVDTHSGTEHDRELLGVWFFGLVLGILLALLGVLITNRIRKKRIARQLEQEEMHQQAASTAPQTYAGFAGPTPGEARPAEQ